MNDRAKLTEDFVTKLKPRDAKFFVWEEGWRGGQFGVRVMPSGVKVYVVRYRVGIGQGAPEKLRKLDDVGNMKLTAARDRAAEVIQKARQGEDILDALYRDTETVVFSTFAREYMASRSDWSQRTLYLNTEWLDDKLIPFFKQKPVKDIQEKHVKAFKQKYADMPVTANRCLRLLRQILDHAVDEKIITTNVVRKVALYREKKSAGIYLKEEEMERLGAAMREQGNYRNVLDFILLMAFTTCRPLELASMRKHQFDRTQKSILLQRVRSDRTTKTKTSRTVALNDIAFGILERLAAGQKDEAGYVLPVNESPQAYLVYVGHIWRKLRKKAQLAPGTRLYDLRHNFASWAAMLNTNQGLVQQLLGHTKMETSEIYMHLAVDPVREASNKVATHIAGKLWRSA